MITDEVGKHILVIEFLGFQKQQFPIDLNGKSKQQNIVLKEAFDKAQQFLPDQSMLLIQKMLLSNSEKQYKTRFMVKAGDRLKTIASEDIAAFYSQDKATFLFTKTERSYAIDYSLDELNNLINKTLFFKVNRKFIVSIDSGTNI